MGPVKVIVYRAGGGSRREPTLPALVSRGFGGPAPMGIEIPECCGSREIGNLVERRERDSVRGIEWGSRKRERHGE